MKFAVLTLVAALAVSHSPSAQSPSEKPAQPSAAPAVAAPDPFASVPAPKLEDVKSIDSIMAAVYDVISGPPGERDWSRFRSLFLPTARLTAATKGPDGTVRLRPMTADEYATRAGGYFLKNGFFEHPIVNHVQAFGNVAQVFSSYESRHAAGEAPFVRGINSFQLLNDGKRWWVVSILWDEERPDNPLPKDFASKP
jgi:hypothetical protein